jgi:hypothetical protein
MVLSLEVVALSSFGDLDFFGWGFLCFLRKSVSDDDQFPAIKETQEPEDVAGEDNTDLPNVRRTLQLLEIRLRDAPLESTNGFKRPYNLLPLFVAQVSDVIRRWFGAVICSVEVDFPLQNKVS